MAALSEPDDPSALAALEAEHEGLLSFLYLCPAGVVQAGLDGAVRMINPHAAQLLMPLVRVPAIVNLFDALGGVAPELRNLVEAFSAERGHVCQGRRLVVSAGGPGPRVLSCSLLRTGEDCLVALLQDISREVEQERQIRQGEALFAALVAGVNDFALFSLDPLGRIDGWNCSGERLCGLGASEVLGRDLDALCHAPDLQPGAAAEQVLAAAREGWSLREARCRRHDGRLFWSQILVAALGGPGGEAEGFSVVVRDITERRMTGDEMRRLLTTDHLTGAANRARFFETAEVELGRRARTGGRLSAIMLDVDHFKRINDGFGHAAGDALLRALVRCCDGCLREGDLLARLGGEEFAVLLPATGLSEALEVAEVLRAAVAMELSRLDGLPVDATVSLGCAEMDDSRHDGVDALLREADEALYRAKRAGRNQVAGPPQPLAPQPMALPQQHPGLATA